jgi:hypothetical protein
MSEEDCERLLSGRFNIQISLVERKADGERANGERQLPQDDGATAASPPSKAGETPDMHLDAPKPERTGTSASDRMPMHKGLTQKQFKRAHGPKQDHTSDVRRPSMEELRALATKLDELKTRDEAQELLRQSPSLGGRENIARLAKFLKVYVAKHDDRDTIERKIIEFTVGAKLRTDAIQGLNLKRSGNPNGS